MLTSTRQRRRLFPSLVVFSLLMALAIAAPGAMAAPARQAGPQTWTVLVGAQAEMEKTDNGMMGAWQIMRFYPDKLTVNEGDTVIWKLNSAEFHVVVFPPPGQNFVPFVTPVGQELVINPATISSVGGPTYDGTGLATSGLLDMAPPGVMEYKLTLTKAGSYNYLCSVHSNQLPNGQVVGMLGNVTVQAAGSALAKTPDQVSADAQAAIAADQQAATAADAQAKQVNPPTSNADGTMTYHVNAGYDAANGTYSYMRFSPSNFTVHVGDTVEWQQASTVTPHTVTLLSGGKDLDTVIVTPQASGPPKFTLNPAILAPSGGASYAGAGLFNSGFMSGTQDPAPGPRSYKLTFTKPGKYEYICSLHDGMGMNGFITVLPAGATPGMPATGGASGQNDSLPIAAGLAALALLLGGVAFKRRSARSL